MHWTCPGDAGVVMIDGGLKALQAALKAKGRPKGGHAPPETAAPFFFSGEGFAAVRYCGPGSSFFCAGFFFCSCALVRKTEKAAFCALCGERDRQPGFPCFGGLSGTSPRDARNDSGSELATPPRFFFCGISEPADGERRGTRRRSGRFLKTRLTRHLSDATPPI